MGAPTTRQRLLDAAVDSFAEKGFSGTTTRDIAARAGMSPAAVYVHHDSKEHLLYEVSLKGHQDALEVVNTSRLSTSDPIERIRRIVYDFTSWHAEHHRVGRIVQYEFHALSADHRREIAALRRQIEASMRQALTDGIETGALQVSDVSGTALALLSLSIDVVRWFSPDGVRRADDIAELYANLAVRMTTS